MKNIIISVLVSLIVVFYCFQVEGKVFELSLEQTTELALTNNFDIQLAKYQVWISHQDIESANSIFDTIFNADVNYVNDQFKRTSTIFGTKNVDNEYDLSLSKKLPTATTLTLDMSNDRQSTNSSFTTSPLTHDSSLGITVKQELGRNFFGLQDRGDIKLTQLEIDNTRFTSLDKIETYLAQVQKAYWDLVFHIQKMELMNEMLFQAKKLYESDQKKLKSGAVERIDALISESNYKRQQSNLAVANQEVQMKSNVLALYLNLDHDDLMIKPLNNLDKPENNQDWNLYLAEAFKHRRDYIKIQNDIKSRDIHLLMMKNNLWPEINLTASFKRNGLGDHFKPAIQQISEEDNPYFSTGISVSVPIENHEAKSQFKKAELEKAKTLIEMKLLEKRIAIELMDQIRECRVYEELAVNNKEIADLQNQKYEEEEKRFFAGRSDMDTLVRYQQEAVQAKILDVESKFKYQAAVIDLEQKSAVLLNKYWDIKI